jgi:hypothetical protein
MWPLKKSDPEIGFTPEDAFEVAFTLFAMYFLWQWLFPWWPVWK